MQSISDLQKFSNHLHTHWKNMMPKIYGAIMDQALTIGEYKWTCRTSDFGGWLMCDGRSVSRTEFGELFEYIGTAFGSENDETFRLPDFRSRVMGAIGQGSSDLSARGLGDAVGDERHTLSTSELPSHTHTGQTADNGSHSHTASASSTGQHNHGGYTATAGDHSHTTNATGGNIGLITSNGQNTAFETDTTNNEPNLYNSIPALNIDNAGNHSHILSTDGAHSHTITITNEGMHGHAFTTSSIGGGQSHNNMQPTLFAGNVFVFAKRS